MIHNDKMSEEEFQLCFAKIQLSLNRETVRN